VVIVRERGRFAASLAAGCSSNSSSGSSLNSIVWVVSSASGTKTSSSVSSSKSPNASRNHCRSGLDGSSASSRAFAATGSRSSRSSRNSATFSRIAENGVPVKISSPSADSPPHTIAAPIGEIRRDSGQAAITPTTPPASAKPSTSREPPKPSPNAGLPLYREMSPRIPRTSAAKPMNIRTRSSRAVSRNRIRPQSAPTSGNA
jgi:hypothetical protein